MDDLLVLVEQLRAAGKRVIVITAPPSPMNDAGKCNVRKYLNLPRFGLYSDCTVPLSEARAARESVDGVLRQVEAAGVPVFWFYDVLCSDEQCQTSINDTALYRDFGHLNQLGSEFLGRELGA